jgi:hypothetical protein
MQMETEPIILPRADKTLTGQVLDDESTPVVGATVNLVGILQPVMKTTTDKEGRFKFTQVCGGEVFVIARHPTQGTTVEFGGMVQGSNITLRIMDPRKELEKREIRMPAMPHHPTNQSAVRMSQLCASAPLREISPFATFAIETFRSKGLSNIAWPAHPIQGQ